MWSHMHTCMCVYLCINVPDYGGGQKVIVTYTYIGLILWWKSGMSGGRRCGGISDEEVMPPMG